MSGLAVLRQQHKFGRDKPVKISINQQNFCYLGNNNNLPNLPKLIKAHHHRESNIVPITAEITAYTYL